VEAADILVDLALKRDAPDNVTVVVVRVTSSRPIPPTGTRRGFFRRR
jgi:serine/threonine protein phosphatase PrpC